MHKVEQSCETGVQRRREHYERLDRRVHERHPHSECAQHWSHILRTNQTVNGKVLNFN